MSVKLFTLMLTLRRLYPIAVERMLYTSIMRPQCCHSNAGRNLILLWASLFGTSDFSLRFSDFRILASLEMTDVDCICGIVFIDRMGKMGRMVK